MVPVGQVNKNVKVEYSGSFLFAGESKLISQYCLNDCEVIPLILTVSSCVLPKHIFILVFYLTFSTKSMYAGVKMFSKI